MGYSEPGMTIKGFNGDLINGYYESVFSNGILFLCTVGTVCRDNLVISTSSGWTIPLLICYNDTIISLEPSKHTVTLFTAGKKFKTDIVIMHAENPSRAFYIEGKAYKLPINGEGFSTWAEWIETKYNTDGVYINQWGFVYIDRLGISGAICAGGRELANSKILPYCNYWIDEGGGDLEAPSIQIKDSDGALYIYDESERAESFEVHYENSVSTASTFSSGETIAFVKFAFPIKEASEVVI